MAYEIAHSGYNILDEIHIDEARVACQSAQDGRKQRRVGGSFKDSEVRDKYASQNVSLLFVTTKTNMVRLMR